MPVARDPPGSVPPGCRPHLCDPEQLTFLPACQPVGVGGQAGWRRHAPVLQTDDPGLFPSCFEKEVFAQKRYLGLIKVRRWGERNQLLLVFTMFQMEGLDVPSHLILKGSRKAGAIIIFSIYS